MLQASLARVKDKLRKVDTVDAALVVLQLLLYVIVFAHIMQFIRPLLIKSVYTGPNIAPGFFAIEVCKWKKIVCHVFLVFYMDVLTKYWQKVVLGKLRFMYFYSSVCRLD